MKDTGDKIENAGKLTKAFVVPASKSSDQPSSHGVVLLLLLLLTSCGYHFTPVGGIVPATAKTIAIPVFINGTLEPFIDSELTQAVVDEFLTDGRLQVVSPEAADIILKGSVTRFEITPTSYSVNNYAQSYNITIGVRLTIIDAKTQKVLLQDQGVGSIFNAVYAVSLGDITQTKIAKDVAIKSACKSLASTLRSRVLEGL
jgi:lipopolysaccharide assembly LptE-like protein